MQANWSLILNVLLLIAVVVAIGRLMKNRRENVKAAPVQQIPAMGQIDPHKGFDDIIAVRKVTKTSEPAVTEVIKTVPKQEKPSESTSSANAVKSGKSILLFLQAKENRQLVGYELLQTLLASGLRFGEGNLFHRHQQINGQGPVLFSLAAATATGMFDLQNIGAFYVRGLCLFMQTTGQSELDEERFQLMLTTAKQLSEGLDTKLLDDQQQLFNEKSLVRYYRQLGLSEVVADDVVLM